MDDLFKAIGLMLRFAWRWSLLVTVPVGVLFVYWTARTTDRYLDLGVEFGTLNDAVDLNAIGALEGHAILRDLQLGSRPRRSTSGPKLRAIELYVPESSERALLSAPPHSGRHYVEASLAYPDGDIHKVEIKFRGDHFWHWAGRKRSLRIKTKKKHLFERMKVVNLNAPKMPDQISGHISMELARQLGLIAPRSEMVDLYVNGAFRGVHLLFEQMEEMTLRTSGRMPGDLYAGDIVMRDSFNGLSDRLFENAGLWEKIAVNNHFDEREFEAMERLVELCEAPPSKERSDALAEIIDIDAFGRYAAYRLLCQSYHYSHTHNWRLYYDPWKTCFVPAVWDPVGWHVAWVPKRGQNSRLDMLQTSLDHALIEDHAFIAARQNALDEYFVNDRDDELLAIIDETLARSASSIDRDPGLRYMHLAQSVEDIRDAQQKFRASVVRIFQEVEMAYRTPTRLHYAHNPGSAASLVLRMDGRRPFKSVELDLLRPPLGPIDVTISWLTPNGSDFAVVSGATSISGTKLSIDVPICSQLVPFINEKETAWRGSSVHLGPGVYGINLGGPGYADNEVVSITGRLSASETVPATSLRAIKPVPMANAQRVVRPTPRRTPQVWSGVRVVTVDETIEDDVIIEPGTVVRMAPGASIFFRGRVVARGSAEAPIRFEPQTAGQDPWGVVALVDEGCDRSDFSWVEMWEGSGHKVPMSEYSAMFSVHNVDDLTVSDCTFKDSKVVDDMVHAVYSTVHFKRCTFIRSLFDAVDLDISQGVVEDCTFIRAGNDALDLMTSTIVVRGTTIENSGDKGISVGEDTEVFVVASRIKGCEIGMQIKDRSRAIVASSELLENKMGIDAYKKNWRYDSGGFGFLYKVFMQGNGTSLTVDKFSKIQTYDCSIETPPEAKKRIVLDEVTDIGVRRDSRTGRMDRMPDESERDVSYFRPFWNQIDKLRRGLPRTN